MALILSCKKESPIKDLGHVGQSDAHKASLRVTLNDRNPSVGSDIIITATTWHISDQIEKVEFYKTAIEKYTVNLELANTELNNWKANENAFFLIADTLSKKEIWKSVSKNELNSYFQTVADAYVIRGIYQDFHPVDLHGADLINSLTVESFESLKIALSNQIVAADYKILFPNAAPNHTSGVSVTSEGKKNLVNSLTKSNLIANGLKSATKVGQLVVQLNVKVTAEGNAVSEVNNEFQAKY